MTQARFDTDRKARFCEFIAKGYGRTKACEKIGITRQTFSKHYQRNETFRKAVIDAESSANDVVEMALYKTAIDGNVTAQQVWLYNRSPDRWMDRRNLRISGDQVAPIKIESKVELEGLTDAQLRALVGATEDGDQ